MVHEYTPPRSDTFSFLVFTLIVAVVGLTIKSGEFRRKPAYQYLATACLACIVFVFPSMIYLRLALSQHSDGPPHAWQTTRNLLFIESGVQLSACGILALLWVLKYRTGPDLLRSAGPADIHWRLDKNAYGAAKKRYGENCLGDKELTKFFKGNVWNWRYNMAFFWYQYLLIYIIFIPFSLACNTYIAYTLYRLHITPGVTLFADSIFFIVFGVTMVPLFIWFWNKLNLWQAWCNFSIIFHSAIICYFISDTAALTSLLLASLTIFLSTLYDTIKDASIKKLYCVPACLCQQHKAWSQDDPFEGKFWDDYVPNRQRVFDDQQVAAIYSAIEPIITAIKQNSMSEQTDELGRTTLEHLRTVRPINFNQLVAMHPPPRSTANDAVADPILYSKEI
ncbi:MAG: hypothetical protein M1813_002725 [Trichoglossum hirsutum]|nr:MAG: hypothetical protein M1813_002725 [Trichoglossum hirsutum]